MVRDGYKMTELGEIPVDWDVISIEDSCELIVSNVDKKINHDESPVYLCNYMDVFKNEYITQKIPFMEATAKLAEINKYSIKKSDVIITKDSETAEEIAVSTVVTEDFTNVLCGYHLAIIRPKKGTYEGIFLSKLLNLPTIHNHFVKSAKGVTRYGLTKDAIMNALLPLPPLPEQQKIASILSSVDETIEETEALIEKYQHVKKGLMSDLLTKGIDEEGCVRSEQTHEFKDSVFGRVPVEWETDHLNEFIKIITQGPNPNYSYTDTSPNHKALKTKDIYDDIIYYDKAQHLDKRTFEECKNAVLQDGDLLIAIVGKGSIGKVNMFKEQVGVKFIFTRALGLIRVNSKQLLNEYLLQYLRSSIGKKVIDNGIDGSTGQEVIRTSYLKQILISIPPLPEQKRIAEILTSADNRIEKEEAYRDKLLQMKKGLMQDLLTGRVRVTV
jgi:type I restriction enzyme S subunit